MSNKKLHREESGKKVEKEEKLARSLRDYLRRFFPDKDYDIIINVRGRKDEWSDINVYRKPVKSDSIPVMLVETKSAGGNICEAMGEAMWQKWEVYEEFGTDVPTYIASPYGLRTKFWNTDTAKGIFEHFKIQIGILVQDENRKQAFNISSDPSNLLSRRAKKPRQNRDRTMYQTQTRNRSEKTLNP